jgi:predicted phosphate transport protein (TIGR00153 family)
MFGRFLPRQTNFFDLFDEHTLVTAQALQAFIDLVDPAADRAACAVRIKTLEHQADTITHKCHEALHTTFITPIERDSIFQLIGVLDDIIDNLESASERIVLYELTVMRPEVREMADVLVRAMVEIQAAVGALRSMKNAAKILKACVAINGLENEMDALLRLALARIFREEKDPLTVIKWKEIFESLEEASDRCEDAAQIIEGVVLEQA